MQERLLSRRNVYFGLRELFFECCTINASETWSTGKLKQSSNVSDMPLKMAFHYTMMHNIPNLRGDIYNLNQTRYLGKDLRCFIAAWHSLIRAYTDMCLSRTSHKMVALAGLVLALKSKTGPTYVGGLWKELLLLDLLWCLEITLPPLT
jgi:hypothetical protein